LRLALLIPLSIVVVSTWCVKYGIVLFVTKMNSLWRRPQSNGPMARALAKVRKVGGSLMVTLPKELVEQEDIREGVMVEMEVRKAQGNSFGITPGVGPFAKDDKMRDND